MANNISLKNTKASTAMHNSGKPSLGYKTLDIETGIHFYEIEVVDKTEEDKSRKSLSFKTQA